MNYSINVSPTLVLLLVLVEKREVAVVVRSKGNNAFDLQACSSISPWMYVCFTRFL